MRELVISEKGVFFNLQVKPGYDCEKCPVAEARLARAAQLVAELRPLANLETRADWNKQFFVKTDALDEEPARTIFADYREVLLHIDQAAAQCRFESEEIFRDGQSIGMFCPSTNQEQYFTKG